MDKDIQIQLAEMLFYFHGQQMCANAQVMASDTRKREEKFEFNSMLKILNRFWKSMDKKFEMAGEQTAFEDLAAELGDVVRLYITSSNPELVMKVLQENQIPASELACVDEK